MKRKGEGHSEGAGLVVLFCNHIGESSVKVFEKCGFPLIFCDLCLNGTPDLKKKIKKNGYVID